LSGQHTQHSGHCPPAQRVGSPQADDDPDELLVFDELLLEPLELLLEPLELLLEPLELLLEPLELLLEPLELLLEPVELLLDGHGHGSVGCP
jgi:hypothetical protein